MATKYLAFGLSAGGTVFGGGVAGNDSNDGSSFADRVLTISSGMTAARTAPGDVVRIMKSEDPVSLGIDATFTNKSDTVTLASALTATIEACNATWTAASANVTMTATTTRKEGSNALSLAIGSSFTTGKVAYKTLASTTDFSAYQKITFWWRPNATVAAGVFSFSLCSDSTGDTPVNTLTINQGGVSGAWKCITVDYGAALGSSINSVAFNAVSDPGTVTLFIDNIEAANNLTLTSLISLSSSPTAMDFWPIRSIIGTTVKLDQGPNFSAQSTAQGFSGTTATATCYKREPIRIASGQTTQEGGSSDSSRITYSGGWDTTAMTTQDGLTFIDLGHDSGTCISVAHTYLSFEKIVTCRSAANWNLGASSYTNLDTCGSIDGGTGNGAGIVGNGTGRFNHCIKDCTVLSCGGIATIWTGKVKIDGLTVLSCANDHIHMGLTNSINIVARNIISNNSGTSGLVMHSGSGYFYNVTARDNSSCGVRTPSNTISGVMRIWNLITSGTSSTGAFASDNSLIQIFNASLTDAAAVGVNNSGGRVEVSCFGNSPTDNRTYEGNANTPVIVTDASTVHSPATLSQKHTPTSNHVANFPLIQYIQSIPVAATGTHTFSVWVRRSTTNVGARLLLRAGQCTGVLTDQTSDASASANTWEQLSISTSPGQAVPLQFELQSWYISGAGDVFFSDAVASQV